MQGQRGVISEPTSRFLLRITGLIVLVRYSMLIGLILNLWNVCVSSKSFPHKPRSLSHHCVALAVYVHTHLQTPRLCVNRLKIATTKIDFTDKLNEKDEKEKGNLEYVVYYYKC